MGGNRTVHIHREGGGWKIAFGGLGVFVLLFIAGLYTGVINFNSVSGGHHSPATQNTSVTYVQSGSPKLEMFLGYLNQTTGQPQVITTGVNVMIPGSTPIPGTSGNPGWINGTVPANTTAPLAYGDNVKWALVKTQPVKFTQGTTTVYDYSSWALAALSSVQFVNKTNTYSSNNALLTKTANAGQAYKFTEVLNLGNGGYGPAGIEAGYAFNTSQVASVVPGKPTEGCVAGENFTLDPVQSTPSTFNGVANSNFQAMVYSIPNGDNCWSDTISFPVTVTMASGYTAGNGMINAYVAGKYNYLYKGTEWLQGALTQGTRTYIGLAPTLISSATENTLTPGYTSPAAVVFYHS